MSYKMDPADRVELREIMVGNAVQLIGTIEGRAVTLGMDIFRTTDDHLFAIGFAEHREDNGKAVLNPELSDRFFRLPREGIIEPGELSIDFVPAPLGLGASQIDRVPVESWQSLRIGCVAMEIFHFVAE